MRRKLNVLILNFVFLETKSNLSWTKRSFCENSSLNWLDSREIQFHWNSQEILWLLRFLKAFMVKKRFSIRRLLNMPLSMRKSSPVTRMWLGMLAKTKEKIEKASDQTNA